MTCHGIQIAFLLGLGAIVGRAMTDGTPTRFVTDSLPTEHQRVTVHQSKNGTIMPSVANGYIGTVIYSDSVHVSGVFNGKAYPKTKPVYPVYFYEHAHRARIPSTVAIDFRLAGIKGKTSYALDVLEGVFYKWFKAENLDVEQRIYAHRSRKNLLVVEISAKNNNDKEFLMSLSSNRGDSSVDVEFKTTESNRSGASAAFGMVNETEEAGSMRANLAMVWTKVETSQPLTIKATAEEQTWYYITSIATSLDTKFDPLIEALYQWDEAMLVKERLLAEHKAAWKTLWETGRIDIEGDLEMAQAVYGSMYYILSSTRHDWPYGLSPGGLPGGEEYMGHTFWDQDIWMYPPLVLLHPDLARSSLKYRKDRLPAARRIAKEYGYKGAMFPWESSYTGLETSPGERYGKNQIHINGDIAFAAKQFWMASKDSSWLQEVGYPLVYQTAEYWASRVEYDVANDRYVINHVMPPDEYHYPVNNSVYTNVVAKMNLLFAREAADILGREIPKEWLTIAEKMYIPFDSENNYHPEYEGYTLGKEVKQADTILIGFPLMYDMNEKVRYNDLKLYEERTDPDGPAMTHSMFAIGWLDLGEKKKAEKPFLKNYENIRGPFKVWTERRDIWGAVNFITGAGGFLQTVLYGYGGFRLKSSGLSFNPWLPPNVTKMTISVHYLGSLMDFAVTEKETKITLLSSGPISPSLEISATEGVFNLEHGSSVTVSNTEGAVRVRDFKRQISSQACDHTPLHICILFLVSFCLYFLITNG